MNELNLQNNKNKIEKPDIYNIPNNLNNPQNQSELNNSNKSIANSGKKKTPPKKAEKRTKTSGNLSIAYLSTKRLRPNNTDTNSLGLPNFNSNPEMQVEDNIEFSSKNVIAITPLFSKARDNTKMMNGFINRSGGSTNNNNISIINNIYQPQSNSKPIKSDVKINEYFKTSEKNINNNLSLSNSNTNLQSNNYTLNNINNLQTPDTNFKVIKKLTDESERFQQQVAEIKKLFLEKEKECEKLKHEIIENEDHVKNLSEFNKQSEIQLTISKRSLVKYLKELEDIKRTNIKKHLNEQEYKLGKVMSTRMGNKSIDTWEQGDEYIRLNIRSKAIEKEKELLDQQKRNLVNFLRKKNTLVINNTTNNDINNVDIHLENEVNDHKELILFKLASFAKEDQEIKDSLEKLDIEKTLSGIESKRVREEDTSRYGSLNSIDRWPVLSNRYLILSLLGKGGYSEVYKAYDLVNHIEVACKIHQLNSQWSDSIKENYIKHTIRENQIHKDINHSKVVKHYDTIEIDNSSFCTVLELCTGPDLHTYLKMHKNLIEKEARVIISQILYGLEYLNKLPKKIIHYDLKPQNIIFHKMEVKISDFGLAKIMEDNKDIIELTSQGVGTYWYLPPECFDNSRNPPGISSKVDIWSVGVILYELLYGSRPFGHAMTQDKILKEGIIINARKVDFPPKPVITDDCKVNIF